MPSDKQKEAQQQLVFDANHCCNGAWVGNYKLVSVNIVGQVRSMSMSIIKGPLLTTTESIFNSETSLLTR